MKKLLILIIGLNFISCSRFTPSGFWLNHKPDLITNEINEQGPWGGTLAINWKSKSETDFNINELIKIADKNSWKFIDSIKIDQAELKKMADYKKSTIQLPLKNFEPNPKGDDYKSKSLPFWIEGVLKLYRFKTNMRIFEPGTDDSTNETGFILLSENKLEMSVYHIWGE